MKASRILILLILGLVLLSGCTTGGEVVDDSGDTTPPPTPKPTPKPSLAAPPESATQIYLGMLQTGLDEVVVDVKQDEVLIAFLEDTSLNNEALIYYGFGLGQEFEPTKQKTTILIFGNKTTEASADHSDIKALANGQISNDAFEGKIRWI